MAVYFPGTAAVPPIASWSGVTGFTGDRAPILGFPHRKGESIQSEESSSPLPLTAMMAVNPRFQESLRPKWLSRAKTPPCFHKIYFRWSVFFRMNHSFGEAKFRGAEIISDVINLKLPTVSTLVFNSDRRAAFSQCYNEALSYI